MVGYTAPVVGEPHLVSYRSIGLELAIAQDRIGLGKFAAARAAELIRQAMAAKGSVRLIVATGSSQFEVLESLVQTPGIDWSRIDGFHLDEYIGLGISHPASFCGYLKSRFVDRVPLRSFHYLDGTKDAKQVCDEASRLIQAEPVDLALVGIGENGHLAFNDPPADFNATEGYRIVELDDACRRQQVGEGWFDKLEQVPVHAISMTIQQIMATQAIVCSVPDRRKAQAVSDTLQGSVTPNVPASILQQHSRLTMVLDQGSAAQLSAQWIHLAKKV
jgi:glucosamine-6-phosphate deaminase